MPVQPLSVHTFGTLLVGAVLLSAQSKPKVAPALNDALLETRQTLVVADGKFSGAGAHVLQEAIARSSFVLVGEDHLTREIPQFVAAVCDLMHPDAYAVESGPTAAEFAGSLAKSSDRIERMAARSKAHPNNMAFLDIREENDLAAHCAASSPKPDYQLWGLDQEFVGSAGTLLDAMMATGPGPRSREAIGALQIRERNNDQEARRTGDPGNLFLLSSTDADMKLLTDALTADGTAATNNLLREYTESRAIYQLNAKGSPDSNRIRAELLKRHFMTNYSVLQAHVSEPHVLLKFGDYHLGKGFSPLHQRDLGNFVAELADGQGAQSLHILVLGARGTHANFVGYMKPLGHQPFVMTDDPDYKWLAPAVSGLLPQGTGNSAKTYTLFDLRSLRFRGIEFSKEWERIVYSYDLFVFIPELTPAEAIQ